MDTNMLTYISDIWDTTQKHDRWENGGCTTWDIIAQPNAIMLGLHIVTSPCQHVPIVPYQGYTQRMFTVQQVIGTGCFAAVMDSSTLDM